MHRVRRAALVGLLTGVLGVTLTTVPSWATIDDDLGLRWMFWLRGPIDPPQAVAIVSIDETSAARLGLPERLRDWPRSVHARLVDKLVELGASAIAFDIEFFRHGSSSDDDQKLADAATRAHRVVFIQRFEAARIEGHEVWQSRAPIPALARAAAGLAPVPLPATPTVSWFWPFLGTPQNGDVPTLSAVMLQIHARSALPRLRELLERSGGHLDRVPSSTADLWSADDLLQTMQVVRRQVVSGETYARLTRTVDSTLSGTSDPAEREKLVALVALYGGPQVAYLNYYGPPGSICTIPYDLLVGESPSGRQSCSLQGRAVFVGSGPSRVVNADQPDTYHTVYRQADGVDFSGVEIHATALANLLARRTLRPTGPLTSATMLVAFGALVGGGAYLVRTRRRQVSSAARGRAHATATALGVALLYCVCAQTLFGRFDLIVPLVTPLLVQLPVALVLALVVAPTRVKTLVNGVCLSTDATGYTALADRLPLQQLSQLMGEYDESLGGLVRNRRGEVLDPAGDSLMCLWREPSADSVVRLEACLAALEVASGVDWFNRRHAGEALPTRIGVHAGPMLVQNDPDRGTVELVGDAPNVAQRLQDLNRTLHCRVLASEAVVKNLGATLLLRRLGLFELKGKERRVSVFDIMGRNDEVGDAERRLADRFTGALEAYEAEDWPNAARMFEALLADHPLDGPTRFYVDKVRAR